MITVNAMGDACPIPVVKTKNAIASLKGAMWWRHWLTMKSQLKI